MCKFLYIMFNVLSQVYFTSLIYFFYRRVFTGSIRRINSNIIKILYIYINKRKLLQLINGFKKILKKVITKLLLLHDPFILPFIHSRDFKISKKFFVTLFYFLLMVVRLVLQIQILIKLYFFNYFMPFFERFRIRDAGILYDTLIYEWEESLTFYYYYLRSIFWLWLDWSDSTPFSKFYLYSNIIQIANILTFSTYSTVKNFIGGEDDEEEEVDYDQ